MPEYLTPLELCLETELGKIGLTFGKRELIYDSVMDNILSIQVSGNYIQKIKDLKIRKRMREYLEREEHKVWSTFLVRRQTSRNSRGLYVSYDVFPSEENEEELKRVIEYDKFPKIIDRILRERSFWSEGLQVIDYFYFSEGGPPSQRKRSITRMTQDDVNSLRDAITNGRYDEVFPTREEVQKTIDKVSKEMTDDDTQHAIHLYFNQEEQERFLRSDVPQDILDGLNSPVDDAPELARRIAMFMQR